MGRGRKGERERGREGEREVGKESGREHLIYTSGMYTEVYAKVSIHEQHAQKKFNITRQKSNAFKNLLSLTGLSENCPHAPVQQPSAVTEAKGLAFSHGPFSTHCTEATLSLAHCGVVVMGLKVQAERDDSVPSHINPVTMGGNTATP